jgi:hypothetical protein
MDDRENVNTYPLIGGVRFKHILCKEGMYELEATPKCSGVNLVIDNYCSYLADNLSPFFKERGMTKEQYPFVRSRYKPRPIYRIETSGFYIEPIIRIDYDQVNFKIFLKICTVYFDPFFDATTEVASELLLSSNRISNDFKIFNMDILQLDVEFRWNDFPDIISKYISSS